MSRLARFRTESLALARLTGPLVLAQLVYALMVLLDTVMSGHAGAE